MHKVKFRGKLKSERLNLLLALIFKFSFRGCCHCMRAPSQPWGEGVRQTRAVAIDFSGHVETREVGWAPHSSYKFSE